MADNDKKDEGSKRRNQLSRRDALKLQAGLALTPIAAAVGNACGGDYSNWYADDGTDPDGYSDSGGSYSDYANSYGDGYTNNYANHYTNSYSNGYSDYANYGDYSNNYVNYYVVYTNYYVAYTDSVYTNYYVAYSDSAYTNYYVVYTNYYY